MEKYRVLFLCTGNSCRSQMAEAIVNARLGDRWQAFSAGSKPANAVHPLAIKVLAESGIQHTGKPKSINEFSGHSFDLVITLCSDSEDDCPVWLGAGKLVHMPFSDPTRVTGSQHRVIQAFRQLRDEMVAVIPALLEGD